MAALITVAELQSHIESDLSDPALQRFIDDADADIVKTYGEHLTQVKTLDGLVRDLFPGRPIDTGGGITIVETLIDLGGFEVDTTLAASDFKILDQGRQIRRLGGGTNPSSLGNRWAHRVTITYVPVSDTARRIRVTIDLCKLAIVNEGLQEQEVGDVDTEHKENYQGERNAILRGLSTATRGMA